MTQSEVIIVVDDDPMCLDALGLFLGCIGFLPKCFGRGEEAVQYLGQNGGDVLCAIVDLHLSEGLSGAACLQALQDCHPGLPTLLMTGDSSAEAKALNTLAGHPVLVKPVRPAALSQAIADLRQPDAVAPKPVVPTAVGDQNRTSLG